ncbi:MAG: anhydro-N-acetylmuramic acid kinase [Bacteroidota bacterium]
MSIHISRVLGLMSGSSLDGLDVALCDFQYQLEPTFELLDWNIQTAATLPYSEAWQERLLTLVHANAKTFAITHTQYGRYIGELIGDFLAHQEMQPDFVASHGHTIFHFPDQHATTQIGEGAAIAAVSGYPVVCDFRSMDVALGGQGAPIAHIADDYLLDDYDFYLNLGGIANVTAREGDNWTAFDISGANQVLNAIVAEKGLEYDDRGQLAASGKVLASVLESSNRLDYLHQALPKTLDNQWVQQELLPLFKMKQFSVPDRLRTACEHTAYQVAIAVQPFLPENRTAKLVVTGGGANNDFLMQCLRDQLEKVGKVTVDIPEKVIVDFKEAAMIALMGLMRTKNIPNCRGKVTGAAHDTINGSIYQGRKKQI